VPTGVDVCYTNHADADQDDMDALLALLVAAGVNFVMGVPGADDIMLGYQSTLFHDALAMRGSPSSAGIRRLAGAGGLDRYSRTHPAKRVACCRPNAMTDAPPERAPSDPAPSDVLWDGLRRLTAARIGLARTGASLATGPLLDFRLAHSRA